MNLENYFIADDANDEPCIWRKVPGPFPIPVLSKHSLRHDLRLWDAIVALVEGAS